MKKIFKYSVFLLIVSLTFANNIAFAQSEEIQLPSAGLTPESPFYFLDRFGENLRQFFTFNSEAKARLQIKFAEERIAEIKIMVEEKGVDAKGLKRAQALLLTNIAYAAEIINEKQAAGKDVATLAKTLNDEFDAREKLLDQTFKDAKEKLKEQRKEIRISLLADARRIGDTDQITFLEEQLQDISQQLDTLGKNKDKLKDSLKSQQKKIEKNMDKDDQREEELEHEKERMEELREDEEDAEDEEKERNEDEEDEDDEDEDEDEEDEDEDEDGDEDDEDEEEDEDNNDENNN